MDSPVLGISYFGRHATYNTMYTMQYFIVMAHTYYYTVMCLIVASLHERAAHKWIVNARSVCIITVHLLTRSPLHI